MNRVLACALLGGVILAGATCGDPTHSITIHNGLQVPITEYSYGRRDSSYFEHLSPGTSIVQTWMYPISPDDSRTRRVEADNLSGGLVFCRDFGYQDLIRLNWKIEITSGFGQCPPN